MDDVQFLFDNQLIAAIEKLIKESKHKLLLISPFIDLDKRIQDALREKLTKHDFEIQVLFGKNEDNLYKSIKKDSLEFLKQFPNIEIRYESRLHAKFYLNDFDFIMTSLNLYDYSLANNIEVGIICNYGSKGLLGKVFDGTDTMLSHGVNKVKQDVLGMGIELNPIEKFQTIFKNAELKYKTEPTTVEASGIKGFIGGKNLKGFTVKIDNLTTAVKEIKSNQTEQTSFKATVIQAPIIEAPNRAAKYLSASQISKSLGIPQVEINNLMQQRGLISGDKITDLGIRKGLVMKNYMGRDYIAYPENLEDLNAFTVK